MIKLIFIFTFIIFIILIIILINHYTNEVQYKYIFVTCYFEDKEHSNRIIHNPNNYRKWINTFFMNIKRSNVVVYTDNETLIKKYNPLKIYQFKNIENVPINFHKKELYQYQMKLDPSISEKNWKTKMIWNSKLYFMKRTAKEFISQLYIWIDIGCMRYEQKYNNLPDINKIYSLSKNNEMNFFVIHNTTFIPYKIYSKKCVYIIATSFFGTKQAIIKFSKSFYNILNYYLNNKIYFGTEQNILDYTVFHYFTNSTIYPLYESNCNEKSTFWKFIKFYTNDNCSSNIISYKYYTKINNKSNDNKNKIEC